MNRRSFIRNSLAGAACMSCPMIGGGFDTSWLGKSDEDKYTCEALYYKVTPHGIKCQLCPNNCNVSDIRPGSCRTKFVNKGKLISRAYGNPYYVKTETPELQSVYHFLPGEKALAIGTAGCTLSCQYCKVFNVSQKSPGEVSSSELFPNQVIQTCLKNGIRSIAYTYTEPVAFYEYMLATAKLARSNHIKNIMVSNGFINEEPLRELCKYIDAAIIDVKAFSDAGYQKITGGSVLPVFNTLKILKEMNVWLEISHLLVPGYTDNFDLMEKMFAWMKGNGFENTPFHIHRFEPYFRLSQLKATDDALIQKAQDLAISGGLNYVYSPLQLNTSCPQCRKVIVDRKGSKTINNLKNGSCKFCGCKIHGIWN